MNVPVHVGQPEPDSKPERQLLLQWQRADPRRQRPTLVPAGLAWQQLGAETLWLGMETIDCPMVVLDPNLPQQRRRRAQPVLAGTA